MQNGQCTIRDLLYAPRSFAVPAYQRAYAWEKRQLQDFLQDLATQRLGRPYFLGAVLFEKQGEDSRETDNSDPSRDDPRGTETATTENGPTAGFEEYQIVDGQQRLTTLAIFLSVALRILDAAGHDPRQVRLWKRYVAEEGEEKLRTVPSDQHFFSTYVLGQDDLPMEHFDTPSQRRLWMAKTFFRSQLESMDPSRVAALVKTLEGAKLLVYAVQSRVDAAQIFELNNDRGKPLTRLESIKSFLMYLALLHSRRPETAIGDIRLVFEGILRIAEDCDELGSDWNEDSILRYHCVGFEHWTEYQYNDPKQLIKDSVAKLLPDEPCEWVRSFCTRLLESFQISKQLIAAGGTDGAVGDLFSLGRVGPFFPLLLKTYKQSSGDRTDFLRIVRLLEIFSFRAYGIANKRSDTGLSTLYAQARDFRGDFDALMDLLRHFNTSYWDVERQFHQQLESPNFYWQRRDALYLLWKYENHLRSSRGFPQIPIRDFLSTDSRAEFSIEHIAAQTVDEVASSKIELAGRDEEFTRTWLHSIGNLVLDTHSGNSRKGNDPFFRKLAEFERAPLMSQLELQKFAGKDPDGNPLWDVDAIKARRDVLISFARCYWDPTSV
jgi:hypothetical protein